MTSSEMLQARSAVDTAPATRRSKRSMHALRRSLGPQTLCWQVQISRPTDPSSPTPPGLHDRRPSWLVWVPYGGEDGCIVSSGSRIAASKAVNPGGSGSNDHGSDSSGPRAESDSTITQIVASSPMLPVRPLGSPGSCGGNHQRSPSSHPLGSIACRHLLQRDPLRTARTVAT